MVQKNSIIHVLPFIMVVVVVIIMATATVVEKMHGTQLASSIIYSSWWFCAIWGILAAFSLYDIIKCKMYRKASTFLLHLSFIVILAGALTTHITSSRGFMHLRNGQTAASYEIPEDNGTMCIGNLPFSVTLNAFDISRYKGTQTHSDYSSRLTFTRDGSKDEKVISMNNIAVVDGYRFYQTSYDHDLKGSVLTITYDPYGTGITYTGYTMLFLAAVLTIAVRTSRIKELYRKLRMPDKAAVLVLTLMLATPSSFAQKTPVVAREDADKVKTILVVYNGRVCPLNTLAHDFILKLTGKTSYKGLTPEQLLLSLPLAPEQWSEKEMVKVKSNALKERLGITTPLARVKDFYTPDGRYKLKDILTQEINKSEDKKDKKIIRAVYEADELISLVSSDIKGTLIQKYNGSPDDIGQTRINAEILYNGIPFTTILFISCLTMAVIIALLCSLKRKVSGMTAIVRACPLAVGVFNFFFFALRWYIEGNIPLSNGFETMVFISLVTLVLTSVAIFGLERQKFIRNTICIGGLAIAGLTLLVAHLSEMSPQITSLMPVLHSPWLTTHVSLIMVSYSLFAFTAIIAVVNMFRNDDRLDALNRLILYPAEMCLAVGIFLGAIWANQSWGTYWSWDPKEVWALISLLIYCLPLHSESLSMFKRPKTMNIYLVFAFLSILMTYFGVNYLLDGMHSYAGN